MWTPFDWNSLKQGYGFQSMLVDVTFGIEQRLQPLGSMVGETSPFHSLTLLTDSGSPFA
jgi:hypothetical protein